MSSKHEAASDYAAKIVFDRDLAMIVKATIYSLPSNSYMGCFTWRKEDKEVISSEGFHKETGDKFQWHAFNKDIDSVTLKMSALINANW